MSGEQYQQLRKDAEVYMNQELPFQTIEEENITAGRTINPWDVIKQDAPMTEHELSISGKGEKNDLLSFWFFYISEITFSRRSI